MPEDLDIVPSGEWATLQRANRFQNQPWLGWAVFLFMVSLTVGLWYHMEQHARQNAEERFLYRAEKQQTLLGEHMQRYQQVLRAGRGMFDASDSVSRAEWHRFVVANDLAGKLPGMLGLGYTVMLRPGERAAHEAAVRAEGFPDYAITPSGERDPLSSIVFLEPFSDRNLRAFGYDMYSDPVRREAMERARDSGEQALSGKVVLVQETDVDVQPGFMIYEPVYRRGMPLNTVDERRAALRGFVYAPFRAGDLMRRLFRVPATEIEVELFDGQPAPGNLLFSSESAPRVARQVVDREVVVGGHRWTARFRSSREFEELTESNQPWLILAGGLSLSLLFLVMIFLNIRYQKYMRQATAKVEQSLEKFRTLVENSLAVVYRCEVERPWRVRYVSHGIEAISGIAEERFLAGEYGLADLVDPDEVDLVVAAVERALVTRTPYEVTYRLKFAGDGTQWLNERGRAHYDAQGRPLWLDGIILDVTEQKRAEERLRAASLYARSLLESSLDPLVTISAEGKVTDVNAAAEKVTGRTRAQLIGSDFSDYFTEPDKARAGYLQVFEKGFVTDYPLAIRSPGGELIEVLYNASVYRDESGEIAGVFAAARDVSKLRKTARELDHYREHLEELVVQRTEELTQAKEAAEVANVAKSAFLSNMSHELRTPLNSVIGFAHILLANTPTPRQRDYLRKILHSSQSLLALLSDVLDFSALEANRMSLEKREFALEGELLAAIRPFDGEVRRKQLEVLVDVAADVPPVLIGDALRLRQVLQHLYGNAVKFTEHGEIVICVRGERRAPDELLLSVTVRDTGIGVPEEQKHKLFGRFIQSDGSSTRQYGGTGLGLVLARKLIEKMGGELGFESEAGRGSSFWFRLPLGIAQAPRSAAEPVAAEAWRARPLLVVDDNEHARTLLCDMLSEMGFSVVDEHSGAATLARLQAAGQTGTPVAVVYVDASMPDMDGMATVRAIEALALAAPPSVVLLACDPGMQDEIPAGLAAVLLKPVTRSSLFATTMALLGDAAPASITGERSAATTRAPVGEHGVRRPQEAVTSALADEAGKAEPAAVDRDRLQQLCRVLYQRLLDGDFNSGHLLEENAAVLSSGLPEAFPGLRERIESFDFDGAQAELEAACQSRGIELGSP